MTTVPEPNPPGQFDETQLQVGVALAWPLLDDEGGVLLRAGAVIATEEERRFLLKHFSFYAGMAGVAAGSGDGVCVRVGFPISTAQGEMQFEALARVRNVKEGVDADGAIEYGLEFESVSAEQQFALRSFLFDCLSARSYP